MKPAVFELLNAAEAHLEVIHGNDGEILSGRESHLVAALDGFETVVRPSRADRELRTAAALYLQYRDLFHTHERLKCAIKRVRLAEMRS